MALAKNVLIIRPRNFRSNPQTATDNSFQKVDIDSTEIQKNAELEFEGLKNLLEKNGIKVEVINITDNLDTPDDIFPNNWFSTHLNGTLVLYPMKAPNRRLERRKEIIELLHTRYPNILDLSRNEDRGLFLEGTGSIVLDNTNKKAYAALSERTSSNLLYEWSKKMEYETITFTAYDDAGKLIYHTNVLLTIGKGFCIICAESIKDKDELRLIRKSFKDTGNEIIEISFSQLKKFCGNCIQLGNNSGESFLLMSTQAFEGFHPEQIATIEKYCKIIHAPLDTIESQGGGSARCMIAELF